MAGSECLERSSKARLADLVDEVYARLEKLGELMARDVSPGGRRAHFMKMVILEEVYDRLAEARRLIRSIDDCQGRPQA